jgi:hypothetical protein
VSRYYSYRACRRIGRLEVSQLLICLAKQQFTNPTTAGSCGQSRPARRRITAQPTATLAKTGVGSSPPTAMCRWRR